CCRLERTRREGETGEKAGGCFGAMDSSIRTKLLAGLGMVCISTTVGVLYKASQAASGGFKYSTTSAICMAEMVKLALSCSFHAMDKSHGVAFPGSIKIAFASAKEQLSSHAVLHIYILGFLYAINNQLSFYIYMSSISIWL
ncbi:unnamed protein product, partial [Effrenium voratum]